MIPGGGAAAAAAAAAQRQLVWGLRVCGTKGSLDGLTHVCCPLLVSQFVGICHSLHFVFIAFSPEEDMI